MTLTVKMTLSHLLDTSILSQPIKDHPEPSVIERWSTLRELSLCTSSICLAEMLQGLEQRNSSKYWRRYRELLQDRYVTLPFDQATAVVCAQMAARLQEDGQTRPFIDLMIAATAKRHGLILVTLNTKHFQGIDGLSIEDWMTH